MIKKIIEEAEGVQAQVNKSNNFAKENTLKRKIRFFSDSCDSSDGSKITDNDELNKSKFHFMF